MNQSLATIKKLCEIYKHPELSIPTIHVAGTNGKGSVCTKIAASLQNGGYRVGLYTSPHISTFRERIRIDGQMITEEEIALFFNEINETLIKKEIPATFFEITTLLAFLYFQARKVDVAVIETGLGGTWDATNVISPLLSVITSIGYDHVDVLGPTLEDISREKAGIIKQNTPLVIGPDVPISFMQSHAAAKNATLYRSAFESDDYDEENQETARLALSVLRSRFPLSKEAIDAAICAKPACRFERLSRQKEVVFDVAHNSHGFARLLQKLQTAYPNHRYRFVLGFSRGKDIAESAHLIEESATAIHLVTGPHPRLASLNEIQGAFQKRILELSITQGVQNALNASCPTEEIVVIAGSFFIMQEAREALGIQEPQDPCIWYDPLKLVTPQKAP